MSEIPATNDLLIAEIFGWKWDGEYDTEAEVVPAISDVRQEYPELDTFCDKMREFYADTDEGMGPMSWRDFRNMTAHDRFKREFDWSQMFYEIEGRIRLIAEGRPLERVN